MKMTRNVFPVLALALFAVGCTEKPAKEKSKTEDKPAVVVAPEAQSARVGDVAALTDNLTGQEAVKAVRTDIANANDTDLVIAIDVLSNKVKDLEKSAEALLSDIKLLEDMKGNPSEDQAKVEKALQERQADLKIVQAQIADLSLERDQVKIVREVRPQIEEARKVMMEKVAAYQSETDPASKLAAEKEMHEATAALNSKMAIRDLAMKKFNEILDARVKK